MTIKLKLAIAEDAEQLKLISVQAFANDCEQYGAYPPGIESLDWHKSEIHKGHYYKILYGDEVAGGICVIPSPESQIEIKYFFIADNFQNKRIGSATMTLIEKQYNNVQIWNLVTPYKAYRNHHFYEKFGYSKVGEIQPEPSDPFKVFKYQKLCPNNT